MRGLLWVSVLMMGLWSGYWFVGKTTVDRAAAGFFAAAPDQGLDASHNGLTVAGFPNRFDLTVTDPQLADRLSGYGWQAAFVQIFSLSYKPWHVIAAFAPEQTIFTPYENLNITSNKLQASVIVEPEPSLPLDRTTVIGSTMEIASTLGWRVAVEDVRFATRQDPSRTNVHEVGLDFLNMTPDSSLSALMEGMPSQIEKVHLDAFVGFSAPLDRFSAQSRPKVELLEFREVSLLWGELSLFAKGELSLPTGSPEGRLDIRFTGWRKLLPVMVGAGMVKPEVLPTVERMLEVMASQSGDPNVIEVPLVFADGQMKLGPLPLGPAPQF